MYEKKYGSESWLKMKWPTAGWPVTVAKLADNLGGLCRLSSKMGKLLKAWRNWNDCEMQSIVSIEEEKSVKLGSRRESEEAKRKWLIWKAAWKYRALYQSLEKHLAAAKLILNAIRKLNEKSYQPV
jgi:hypothetical protein